MRVRLRLWLQMASVACAYSSTDFLQSTLEKIQKERLDTMMMESSHHDNRTGFKGEIVFEDDISQEGHSPEEFEFTFSNNLYEEDQQGQVHPGQSSQQAALTQQAHASQTQQQEVSSDSLAGNNGEVQGYYYYFYPLNHYVQNMQNMQQGAASMPSPQHAPDGQSMKDSDMMKDPDMMKDSDMMMMMMDSMMKNNMMTKAENKITPLFKAISWFIGTAVIFVVSILLMPKLRVKKAKDMFEEREFSTLNLLNNMLILPPSLRSFR